MEWIIAANHKIYDHVKAFEELPYIDWRQNNNFKIGDKVFIYSSKPECKVEFYAEVLKVDIDSKEALNDIIYWKDPSEFYKGREKSRFYRLKLIHYFKEGITLNEMRENGLNGNIQGARRLLDETGNFTKLGKFLNSKIHDEKNTVHQGEITVPRIIFCNIAYMEKYQGNISDKPINGGQYINDTGDAIEKFNFYICNDNKVRGFVETKYVGGYQSGGLPKQIRIENIDSNYKNKEFIDNVVVIFCAKSPIVHKTVIIGWYRNATVYRHRQKFGTRDYNIIADSKDAFLLDEFERNYTIPRAKGDNPGIGQSQVWYANKNNDARKIANDAYEYLLSKLDNKNAITKNSFILIPKKVAKKNDILVQENKMIDIHSNYKIAETNIIKKDNYFYSSELHLKPNFVIKNGTKIYKRNREIAINALGIAGFKCEINKKHKTFIRKTSNIPYTESHHLIPMHAQCDFEYSLDVEENIVSLCSNCHNEIHYGVNSKELIIELYEQRKDLLKSKNIYITLEQLLSYYEL